MWIQKWPIFLKCTNFKDKHENHTSLRFLNIVYKIFMRNHLFCDLLLTYMYWFAATYFHDKNYVINFQQMLKTHYKKLVCSKKYSRWQGLGELYIFSHAIKSLFSVSYCGIIQIFVDCLNFTFYVILLFYSYKKKYEFVTFINSWMRSTRKLSHHEI